MGFRFIKGTLDLLNGFEKTRKKAPFEDRLRKEVGRHWGGYVNNKQRRYFLGVGTPDRLRRSADFWLGFVGGYTNMEYHGIGR